MGKLKSGEQLEANRTARDSPGWMFLVASAWLKEEDMLAVVLLWMVWPLTKILVLQYNPALLSVSVRMSSGCWNAPRYTQRVSARQPRRVEHSSLRRMTQLRCGSCTYPRLHATMPFSRVRTGSPS